jgi:2-enoate reductase
MNPETGAKAVAEGRIDGLGVARQFLADGEWVTKLIEGRPEDIRPCICCHNACFNFTHYKGVANDQAISDVAHMARCALDPRTLQVNKYKIVPTASSKKSAVIGGGIGGMETALVAAKRGHTVTIYEKSDRLGGVFHAAAAPSFKEQDRALIAWYQREIAKFPAIKVKLNTEVKDFSSLDADKVVVATGAAANRLPVKGAEYGIEAIDYLLGKKSVGENVVIIGGGLSGCEIAYDLYLKGKKPTIVEMKSDLIAVTGVCLANSSYLRDFFTANKVPVYLDTKLGEILKDSVIVTDAKGQSIKLAADSVILSVGYRPAPLTASGKRAQTVGDANKVGNLRTVIWNAWKIAMKL